MSSEKLETWQTWSIQRAGFSDSEFEAAEISFIDNQIPEGKGASDYESIAMTELSAEALNKLNGISSNEIRTRLHHLELELTSALCVLRSKSVEHVPKKIFNLVLQCCIITHKVWNDAAQANELIAMDSWADGPSPLSLE